ncbi:MAG: CotH kinase family protein [Paludibacteraceae bacterium]|nr:CotH kinase family protein [Paludibacteraceae bacterium]
MRKKFLLLLVVSLFSTLLNASISITEIMPCNLSSQMNDTYNFAGYVEFFNDSDEDVSLDSCTLVHYKLKKSGVYAEKWSWTINHKFTIKANSYNLLWMDEMEKENHSPYKLDADGGYLNLYSQENTLIDSLSFGEMDAHYAYGKWENTQGYMEPSPYEPNTKAYPELSKQTRCTKPSVSQQPGLADGPLDIELSTTTENAEIYYTIDGTEPSLSNGSKYEEPIHIESNANIRARAFAKDLLPSKIMTASYIYMDAKHEKCGGFQVPIVSITTDPKYFYDDTIGIHTGGKNGCYGEKSCVSTKANYNQDWKRPVSFEYFVDGKRVISQELEVAIEGGCSRSTLIKSLSMKASSKTGDKDIDYYFFKSKPTIKHQTLHLRNGGTANAKVLFRDGLMQTFAIGMNIDYQAYQPVAYYLNGKYMSLMNLNERTNADYLKANYGLNEDEIDLISVSDQKGINASKGDLEAYNELVDYLTTTDPKDSTYYDGAKERMDMAEYIDYQVFQQFIGNTDWPGNNTKIWRERKEGSKFRWILYDTDFGFGLPGYDVTSTVSTNMFNWCMGTGRLQWANKKTWMTAIFSSLSKNYDFRKDLVDKYKEHLETTFSTENIETVFDSIISIVDAEYCATFRKTAETAAESMRTFALNRGANVKGQFSKYLGNNDDVYEPAAEIVTLLYYIPQEAKAMVITEEEIVSVSIYDMSGKKLSEEKVADTYYEYDMSAYNKGVYIFNVRFSNGTVTKKLIIN